MREALAVLVAALVAAPAPAGGPADAVTAALADARGLPADAAAHARYLWLGDAAEKDRGTLTQLVRYQLNAVSTEPDLVAPAAVAPDLLRFDVRDPGPAFAGAWEKTAEVDPLFHLVVEVEEAAEVEEEHEVGRYEDAYGRVVDHTPGGPAPAGTHWIKTGTRTARVKKTKKVRKGVLAAKTIVGCPDCRGWLPTEEASGLALLTQSASPVLGAQWWFARAARQLPLSNREDGTGYYDWMGVKSRDDYFAVLHIREADRVRVLRGVVAAGDSGVAQNGRQVENDDAPFGRYWFTEDVNAPDGDRSVTHQLRRGELNHDAEEWYAPGANGVPKLLLSDAKGVLQATAPDFIGGDGAPGYGGRDLRIHVGLSCIDCHGKQVLLPMDEWARKTFTGPTKLQSPDYQTARDFQRELLGRLEPQRARDAAGMAAAMEEASGLKIDALVTAYDAEWRAYANTPLDADAYGRALGVDGKTLAAALRQYQREAGGVDPALAPLLADKGVISRQVAEEFAPVAHTILWNYKP